MHELKKLSELNKQKRESLSSNLGVQLGNPPVSAKLKDQAVKRGSVLFGLQGLQQKEIKTGDIILENERLKSELEKISTKYTLS